MTLRAIGYWYSDRDPSLPRPQDLVDPTWETAAREAMIDYLERGVVVSVSLGTSLPHLRQGHGRVRAIGRGLHLARRPGPLPARARRATSGRVRA